MPYETVQYSKIYITHKCNLRMDLKFGKKLEISLFCLNLLNYVQKINMLIAIIATITNWTFEQWKEKIRSIIVLGSFHEHCDS